MLGKMIICQAISKYGIAVFHLYILETGVTPSDLSLREDYWVNTIKPSYNTQAILLPFTGANHYRFGKTIPQEVKDKISSTLQGRAIPDSERKAQLEGAATLAKTVYCYEFDTKVFVTSFYGMRPMARA